MPLYKTKTQNYSNSAETDTSTENTFKIPSQNGIQLYRNTRKTHQKASQENTPTLEKQFRKIPSEFKLSIIKQSNGSLRRNSPKFVNRRNRLTENNLSNQPTVNNNTKILRNKTKYRKDISKRINKNLNCTPESKSIHSKLDFNNNINDEILNKSELNTKSSKNLKQTNQHDTSSELDEMIISLWSQDVVPSNEPPKFSSHYEKLLWLQEQRNVGLYVCCDRCDKYRYLKDTVDPLELPNKWYCQMNPDKEHNKCSDPEVPLKSWQEADLIYNTYHAGSVVWAKLDGYPWWPAMVDDDPDTEMYYWLDEYSCVPVWYHVVFFDLRTVSRAWLKPNALCSFKANLDNPIYQPLSRNKFKARILFAKNQAKNAITLPVADRLKEYSFLARWKGRIGTPVDVDCNRKDKKRKTNNTRHNIRRELTQSQKELSRNKFLKNSSIKSLSSKEVGMQKHLNSSVGSDYLSPDLFDENEGVLVLNQFENV